jgi:hypothetical protein
MTTTLASPTTTVLTTELPDRGFAPSGLVAGIGGLTFVGTVLVQNALRARFPANDAAAEEVMRYYADHRGTTLVLAALFAVGSIGIVTFLGGAVARAARGARRGLAIAGGVGGAAIFGMFSVMVALDIAIAGYVHRGAPDTSVVEGLWVLHNSVFGVLLAAIGVTLASLATACAACGLLNRNWKAAGIVGGSLLLVGAATTPAIVDGSPTMFIGVLGFLVWIAFVATASVKMLRSRTTA